LINLIGSVPGALRFVEPCRDELSPHLTELARSDGLFEDAPYQWVGLDIRFSHRSCPPVIRRVNRRWGDLPVTVEVNMESVDHKPREVVCHAVEIAILQALIAVADSYDRPSHRLRARLSEVA
jgi:hypothetical protein